MEKTYRAGVDGIDVDEDGLGGNVDGSTAIVKTVHAVHLCGRTMVEHTGADVPEKAPTGSPPVLGLD